MANYNNRNTRPNILTRSALYNKVISTIDFNTPINRYTRLKQIDLDYGKIQTKFPTPTKVDYTVGIIQRDFLQKKGVIGAPIFEVDRKKLSRKLIATRQFKMVTISWKITGNLYDKYENGIFIPGVTTVNQKEIELVSHIMPDLKRHLVDLAQFHRP